MMELTKSSAPRGDHWNRRGFLKVGCLGLSGLTLSELLQGPGAGPSGRSEAGERPVGHFDLARRRPAPARDLRSQA